MECWHKLKLALKTVHMTSQLPAIAASMPRRLAVTRLDERLWNKADTEEHEGAAITPGGGGDSIPVLAGRRRHRAAF